MSQCLRIEAKPDITLTWQSFSDVSPLSFRDRVYKYLRGGIVGGEFDLYWKLAAVQEDTPAEIEHLMLKERCSNYRTGVE
jgi:hypothetical protein